MKHMIERIGNDCIRNDMRVFVGECRNYRPCSSFVMSSRLKGEILPFEPGFLVALEMTRNARWVEMLP